jgi:hypothetical protein
MSDGGRTEEDRGNTLTDPDGKLPTEERGLARTLAAAARSGQGKPHEMLPIRTTVPIMGVIHRPVSAN